MASLRASQISGLINDLTKIGLTSDATIKFIIDKTPLGNQNQASSSGEWIIVGRLLPNSDIYKQGSIEVHIILGPSFPLQPPNICLKTKVYHPNVNEKGR
jgi:ubiquitin-protein ligase